MTEKDYFVSFFEEEPDVIEHTVITRDIHHRNRWLRICERWNDYNRIWIVNLVDYNAAGNDPDRDIAVMKALEAWDDRMKTPRILDRITKGQQS